MLRCRFVSLLRRGYPCGMHTDNAIPPGTPVPKLESLLREHGFDDVRCMAGAEVVVSPWVRLKCMYGCVDYGKRASCPSNAPGVEECRKRWLWMSSPRRGSWASPSRSCAT